MNRILKKLKSKTSVKIKSPAKEEKRERKYNSKYFESYLDRIAFPIGGIGAGMICLEGTGAISHVSVRNKPDMHNEPLTYAALFVKNKKKSAAKILEGQVPKWKRFGEGQNSGNGLGKTSYGLPRFKKNTFLARFPFGKIKLIDDEIPLEVSINGWSTFIPGDADNSSLPAGAVEYNFVNPTGIKQEAIFSFNSENFMKIPVAGKNKEGNNSGSSIKKFENGFLLEQESSEEDSNKEGRFVFYTDNENVKVNYCWFRGLQFDTKTITWEDIEKGKIIENHPIDGDAPGASLFIPFTLGPGQSKTICLKFCWYVPYSDLRTGPDVDPKCSNECGSCCDSKTYKPWYSDRFKNITELSKYWTRNYSDLRKKTELFSKAFYESSLPPEVLEAVAANLTIIKSPTVLRQTDGKLWGWEGCHDNSGCCAGSCTHVWNYAQSIPHLFPELERTLRDTEFNVSQSESGFQKFRSSLPIRPTDSKGYAAVDGQLGGIIKIYREWRISGNTEWLKKYWPEVKKSLEYCIETWDHDHKGIIEEPHHNTYDIEFWGPDSMSMSFYLAALTAIIKMGKVFNEDVTFYQSLLEKGRTYLETTLYNGKYFFQIVKWKGLHAKNPVEFSKDSGNVDYSPEAVELFKKEGPKYQIGKGCLSDGVLGLWIAKVCGIDDDIIDPAEVKNHLKSVHKYNLKKNLIDHVNPQRPGYAMGDEGGLLLCTWPESDKPSLPFVYSDEVWTGIEYQVASHLIFEGLVDEGLEVVRTCRDRYNGKIRNPFDEYECGYWYVRAMSSYGLIQALTGIRYDSLDQTLYIDSKIGNDFNCFISTETGFGLAGLKAGKPFIDERMGKIKVKNCFVSNNKMDLDFVNTSD